MQTADIREKFLQFFASKGHERIPSSPLVPANDPTLLFTNSGMVQFKDVFLGYDKRSYQTAVTVQRCLRAGGKHNDLENVGYTARHHTFFEMLGNFSFGEYFKEKAIPYAWEFLTSPKWLKIKKEHLWITVFGGGKLFGENSDGVPADDEAAAIWEETLIAAGFSPLEAKRRIIRIPTTDNFWMMGEVGPCGPCSEIYYDKDGDATEFRGMEEAYADVCVEIWNLVFMQYNRNDSGDLQRLPAPCVDTGMGLERIAAVLQKVQSNYDIDLFKSLLTAVEKNAGVAAAGSPSPRVIADHIRSAAFLIADGVLPSNEGRGYVLRRIIRRALRHLHKLAGDSASFAALVEPLAEIMGTAYPLLCNKKVAIREALQREEEGFSTMLKNGMAMLEAKIRTRLADAPAVLSGEVVFNLYDTYGFPPDMTASIARDDYGMTVDEDAFARCMEAQRSRSRAAMRFNVGQVRIDYNGAASEFVGYTVLQTEAEIAAILVNGKAATEARSGDEVVLILNRTPFYAESGGQVGDSGVVTTPMAMVRIDDTQKIRADVWGHWGRVEDGAIRSGDAVHCRVDAARRMAIMRSHSAAHLIHAALRRVLGKHVQQRGSQVSEKAARFDFSHPNAVTAEELREIEAIVNHQIAANAAVETELMSYDDALKTGAMALFGEKYGDRVRVVTIDKQFSVELCGGTHVVRAGDIGVFQFTEESAIAAGIRRVEAITEAAAVARMQTANTRLVDLAAMLKTPTDRLEEKVVSLRDSLKQAQKHIADLQAVQTQAQTSDLAAAVKEVNGVQALIKHIAAADGKVLRMLALQLRNKLPPPSVIVLAGDGDSKAAFVVAVTEKPSVNAKQLLERITAIGGGKGGGKADFAQSGSGDAAKIEAAMQEAKQAIEEFIQN